MKPALKTWGPFTGRQLTTIICVLAVTMLLTPIGAWAAVSFTNVAITDPSGAHRAKVDSTGRLAVGDGSGPLTVDGTISAGQTLPAKPIVIHAAALQPGVFNTIYGPQGKRFGIGSLTITNGCAGGDIVAIQSKLSTGPTFDIEHLEVGPFTTLHLDYPVPLVMSPPSGGTLSLRAFADCDKMFVSGAGFQT